VAHGKCRVNLKFYLTQEKNPCQVLFFWKRSLSFPTIRPKLSLYMGKHTEFEHKGNEGEVIRFVSTCKMQSLNIARILSPDRYAHERKCSLFKKFRTTCYKILCGFLILNFFTEISETDKTAIYTVHLLTNIRFANNEE